MSAREFQAADKLKKQLGELTEKGEDMKKLIAAALEAKDYKAVLELDEALMNLALGKSEGEDDAMVATESQESPARACDAALDP